MERPQEIILEEGFKCLEKEETAQKTELQEQREKKEITQLKRIAITILAE